MTPHAPSPPVTPPWDRNPNAPYIIAEIGVNHDGDADRAVELVWAAHAAGADAIKLQHFKTDLLMSAAARLAAYQRNAGERDPFAMLRRLELSIDDAARVAQRAAQLGIDAVLTVFSAQLVEEAERAGEGECGGWGGWTAYKSASPDVINKPLLEAMARTGRPLIVSTGAATIDEVRRARGWLEPIATSLAFLQCVSVYPTPGGLASLGAITALRSLGVPVGYSDHTTDVDTGALAVMLGARVLEKHLTYDRAAKGPDHAASLDPDAFARYVERARLAPREPTRAQLEAEGLVEGGSLFGTGEKTVLDAERDVRAASRQSITTARAIAAGEALAREDLTIKRPGLGVEPWRLDETIGRTAARDIPADTPLTGDDLR